MQNGIDLDQFLENMEYGVGMVGIGVEVDLEAVEKVVYFELNDPYAPQSVHYVTCSLKSEGTSEYFLGALKKYITRKNYAGHFLTQEEIAGESKQRLYVTYYI